MKADPRSLRVAGSAHWTAEPFRGLQELSFVEYEEGTLTRNANRLHRGLVDIALIPLVEFAAHGGYVGLDCGMACSDTNNQLVLYGNGPLHKLHTIYMHSDCITGAVLLRLLVAEHWRITPRLVRMHETVSTETVKPNEGVLLLLDQRDQVAPGQLVCMDLVREWNKWTGLPMVFNVWATRQETLDSSRAQELFSMLHSCMHMHGAPADSADAGIPAKAEQQEEAKRPAGTCILSFSERVKEGLQHFLDRASSQGLLPASQYQSCMLPQAGLGRPSRLPDRSVDEIINDVLAGKRLGLRAAGQLVRDAPLADLGLAADVIRQRLYSHQTLRQIARVQLSDWSDRSQLVSALDEAEAQQATQIRLESRCDRSLNSLEEYEQALAFLRKRTNCMLEGFPAWQVLAIADKEQLRVRRVVARLVTAGLDLVPEDDGGFLLENDDTSDPAVRPADWLRVVLWVHRFGARSACSIDLMRATAWRDVLTHLHVLRQLQDMTSGFAYFSTSLYRSFGVEADFERNLRVTAVARLFLDNIPAIHAADLSPTDLSGYLGLSFGSNAGHTGGHDLAAEDRAKIACIFKSACS